MSAIARASGDIVDHGTIGFSIESRIVRELGERLVKQPEVALVELVKNAYDADAERCTVTFDPPNHIVVADDGHGMSLDVFRASWMRIGTSAKESQSLSPKYRRVITGEKGIGRFAVRFLGRELTLETVADDPARGFRTVLIADFDWIAFDHNEDLGTVKVPYRLIRAETERSTGTVLTIGALRKSAHSVKLDAVRTSSIAVVSPFRPLLRRGASPGGTPGRSRSLVVRDPGFALEIGAGTQDVQVDVAAAVLENAVLRAVVDLANDRLRLRVYRRGSDAPALEVNDRYPSSIGDLYADIRFFPRRKGTFAGLDLDGRKAQEWVRAHSGVAVFDRTFRVLPYGLPGDDWLRLAADTARRERDPRSSVAKKHFPMDEATRASTQLNYMLRLPYPEQLVGIIQVQGRRSSEETEEEQGLIAAADREGFVDNDAFSQLFDVVRGAVEGIAAADRELQQEEEKREQQDLIRSLRSESRAAIREIENNPNIRKAEKARIVQRLAQTYSLAEEYAERSKEREATLETMSLLGVVAGFMTHEFGAAMHEIETAEQRLRELERRDKALKSAADGLERSKLRLREFITYSQGYIHGASGRPAKPYPARPRIQQVVRVFGKYAEEREITVDVDVEPSLVAALVPVSLYGGIALNLFTNALKAVTARAGSGERRVAFKAWNEDRWHFLEVVDTGVGIPPAMRQRVFDPLFTTTSSHRDPLGSGMGLGLSLVKRGAEAYGGRAEVVDPPPGFVTAVRIRLPLVEALQ